jgi:hypothetical protein
MIARSLGDLRSTEHPRDLLDPRIGIEQGQ